MILHGDCREVMAAMEPNSVDAIVTGASFPQKHGKIYGEAPVFLAPTPPLTTHRFVTSGGLMDSTPITDLQAGIAAEHLVCADLLLSGYQAFTTAQSCPYDIAVEVCGRLLRVQVKATRGPRAIPQRVGHFPAYMWHVRRAGKGGARVYEDAAFDILALVALDVRKIAYLPPSSLRQTVHIRAHDDDGPRGPNGGGRPGKTFDAFSFASALEELAGE